MTFRLNARIASPKHAKFATFSERREYDTSMMVTGDCIYKYAKYDVRSTLYCIHTPVQYTFQYLYCTVLLEKSVLVHHTGDNG